MRISPAVRAAKVCAMASTTTATGSSTSSSSRRCYHSASTRRSTSAVCRCNATATEPCSSRRPAAPATDEHSKCSASTRAALCPRPRRSCASLGSTLSASGALRVTARISPCSSRRRPGAPCRSSIRPVRWSNRSRRMRFLPKQRSCGRSASGSSCTPKAGPSTRRVLRWQRLICCWSSPRRSARSRQPAPRTGSSLRPSPCARASSGSTCSTSLRAPRITSRSPICGRSISARRLSSPISP